MPARKRSAAQRRRDLRRVIELWAEGRSEQEIGDLLGISQPQVSYDLKSVRALLVQADKADIEERCAIALLRFERLYSEAWRAWQDSRREKVTSFAEKSALEGGAGRTRSGARREEREGNPAFLREARECEAAIVALQGIGGPIRHEFTGPNGGPVQSVEIGMTVEERWARVAAIIAAMRQAGTLPPGLLGPDGKEG